MSLFGSFVSLASETSHASIILCLHVFPQISNEKVLIFVFESASLKIKRALNCLGFKDGSQADIKFDLWQTE